MAVGKYCVTWLGRGRVTTIMGRKMALFIVRGALRQLASGVLPKKSKCNHHDDGEDFDTNVLGLLEDLDQTVEERGQPQKPF